MREKFLTPDIIREDVQCIIYTASKNQKIHVRTACFLPVTIAGYTEKVRFLVSNELRNDVTLGRSWLKAQKAVQDHDLDCLYIGEKMRRRVFLSCDNNASPELVAPENFFDYLSMDSRLNTLKQMPYVTHDIELTSDEPFRISPYRYSAKKRKPFKRR